MLEQLSQLRPCRRTAFVLSHILKLSYEDAAKDLPGRWSTTTPTGPAALTAQSRRSRLLSPSIVETAPGGPLNALNEME
jgi:hypothetical protein